MGFAVAQHVVVLSFHSQRTASGRKSEAVLFIEITEDALRSAHTKFLSNKQHLPPKMIHFVILFSRQGKLRLQKWYEAKEAKEKRRSAGNSHLQSYSGNRKCATSLSTKICRLCTRGMQASSS